MGDPTASTTVRTAAPCPSDDEIAEYVSGSSSEADREGIRAHIDTCDGCRAILVAARHSIAPRTDDALAATQPAVESTDEAPRPSAPAAPDGEVFAGRYQLKRLLGTGGMGSVYEALDLSLHRLVALKVLNLTHDKPTERAEAVNRLIREARAMAVLSHKNVVAVYDVGPHGDQVFVAMQLVDGATLRKWLANTPRTPREILAVLHDAGSGLAAAHAARIIHRDFKPDNILISARGTARVTDFGLARRHAELEQALTTTDRRSTPRVIEPSDSLTVTRSGAIVGTPAYMAPEQSLSDGWDARVDQFAFCVTAWEALYGARPYAGNTWSEIYANVITGHIAPPPRPAATSRVIQRALRRGLAADPNERFASMSALLDVIAGALERPRLIRRVALGVAAVGAIVGATIAVVELRGGDSPTAPAVAPVAIATAAPPAPVPPAPPALTAKVVIKLDPPAPSPPAPKVDARPKKPPPKKPPVAGSTTAVVKIEPAKPGVTTPEPPPAIDPRLAELATARRGLDADWRKRELLASDLPAAFATARANLDAALADNHGDAAVAALAQARAAIAGVAIDRAFVDKKLQRLNARISRMPAGREQEYKDLLRDLVRLLDRNDYIGANRKLNQIAGKLGAG